MFRLKCYLLYLLSVSFAESIAGPTTIVEPCKTADHECIIATAQALLPQLAKGVPDLGISSVDPLLIPKMHTENNDFQITLTNVNVYGASKCNFINIEYIKKTSIMHVDLECPHVEKGQYDMNGTVYSIPVNGKGAYTFETDKIRYFLELKLDKIEKDDVLYWNVTNFDYRYEFPAEFKLDFKNLYDGDEERAKVFLDFVNQNGREIVPALGNILVGQLISSFLDEIKKLASVLPADKFELA